MKNYNKKGKALDKRKLAKEARSKQEVKSITKDSVQIKGDRFP